ncbi:hypothetical protein GBA52_022825 [Prunus armeniaca]|nr:hypothetical protein GBA52_022825 [Prunus armeniaca]
MELLNKDDSEAEEDVPRQISPSIAHLITKFSRRTKSVSSNPSPENYVFKVVLVTTRLNLI